MKPVPWIARSGVLLMAGCPMLLGLWAPVLGNPDRFAGTAGTATAGQELEIHFTNPGLANTTVVVLMADDDGHEITVRIPLDGKGQGKKRVSVPKWDVVFLEHATSEAHGIVVKP